MKIESNVIEPLLEKAEQYGKTTFELLKLNSLEKATEVVSTLISRSLLLIVISFFAFSVNIAIALWLGDLLGKSYYGFLAVACFYCLLGVLIYFIHPLIKTRASDSIITLMLKS